MWMSRCIGWLLGIFLSVGLMGQAGAADNRLVRTKEKTRPPRADGSITKSKTHGKSDNSKALDLSEWHITAYGGSRLAGPFVTFQNPDNQQEVVQVFYNRLNSAEIVRARRYIYSTGDGTRTEEDVEVSSEDTLSYTEAAIIVDAAR